jgi:hypothetical protein
MRVGFYSTRACLIRDHVELHRVTIFTDHRASPHKRPSKHSSCHPRDTYKRTAFSFPDTSNAGSANRVCILQGDQCLLFDHSRLRLHYKTRR